MKGIPYVEHEYTVGTNQCNINQRLFVSARNLSKNLREIGKCTYGYKLNLLARNYIQISFFLYDKIDENLVNTLCNQIPIVRFDFTTPKGLKITPSDEIFVDGYKIQ